jgi:hypothetical protein
MRATVLDEPELEFGAGGRHIDPRFGIATYGPVDSGTDSAPSRIRVGIIGSQIAVEGIRSWLQRAREPINAKKPKYAGQATLFPSFPGFDPDHSFGSVLALEERNMRAVSQETIADLGKLDGSHAVQVAVDAYLAEILWLAESNSCDVIVCARPQELDVFEPDTETPTRTRDRRRGTRPIKPDFHDQLKAAALALAPPLQVMRPETWDNDYRSPSGATPRRVQDEATRAWNLHTALYLKAGGAPWRLIRSFSDATSCFLGISFFRSADNTQVHTSVAQMFNERGEGVVVRGGPAATLKDDRRPFLPEEDAHALLSNALLAYRSEHGNFPARLVVHKTSRFTDSECSGFKAAANLHGVGQLELIWVHERDTIRVFRPGQHPPLRGTLLNVDRDRYVLYTRGSIDFYETYPGMYIPDPITIRPVDINHRPELLAEEMLALTKLNWNHSQLDGRLPITLRASRKVGDVLRHVPAEGGVARRYHYYM